MKFILIMSGPSDAYDQYMSWPKELLEANMAFMHNFTGKLKQSGELVGTWGLASPRQAKRVRAGRNGVPITDGVFPESKEFLAGFWIVDVESAERAHEIAAEASTAPGRPIETSSGESIDHLWIEVREIMGSHQDME